MGPEENKIIGLNIRKIRESLGYSQDDLANFLKVQRSVINSIETGKKECSIDHLERLCALFNMDLSDILEEDENVLKLKYTFAFKNSNFTPTDMDSIAHFQHVVNNYLKMKSLAVGLCYSKGCMP